MIKWLLLFGALVAIGDPVLLYFFYAWWGGWVLAAVLFGPIFFGTMLIQITQRRALAAGDVDVMGVMADAFLIPFARGLLAYPGPVTAVMGLMLAVPFPRRKLSGFALRQFMKKNMGGMSVMGGIGGMGGMPGFGGGFPFPTEGGMPSPRARNMESGGLKRAEGRIVEDPRRLNDSDSASMKKS
jgi:UPF0716 family protein affecting phage T7 exclusion